MIVIAEPYVKFRPTVNASRLEVTSGEVLTFSENAVRAFYRRRYQNFIYKITVRIEHGSTKVWIIITALVGVLTQYGSIRQSIDILVKVAQAIATIVLPKLPSVIGHSVQRPEVHQRRLGVPGQLKRLFKKVEQGELTADEATRRAIDSLNRGSDPNLSHELSDLETQLTGEFNEVIPSGQPRKSVPLPRPKPQPVALPPQSSPSRRHGVVADRDETTGRLQIMHY